MTTSDATSTGVRRVTVNLPDATFALVQRYADTEGATLTEAVKRLLAYGAEVWREVRVNDARVFVVRPDAEPVQVRLV